MTTKKKILFVHHNSEPGGAESSFFDLATGLTKKFTPHCAVPYGPLLEKLNEAGIKTYPIPIRKLTKSINPFQQLAAGTSWLKVSSILKDICQKEAINLIHANSLTSAIYASKTAGDLKLPLVWHERDLTKHPWLTPKVAKFATRIIAISEAVAENLKSQLPDSDRIKLIYNGIDVAKFANPSLADIPDLPKDKMKVLMAGQFVEWKGHLDFIDAAKLIKKQYPNTVFIMAGEKNNPDQKQYITKLESVISQNGLENDFIWSGFVENMPGLLSSVNCVVVPSHSEPFGRIAAEAMAAKKAIVAYDSGALPEIIVDGNSGCLLPDGNINELAKNICSILQDEELSKRLGRNAKLRVSQKFTIEKTVGNFEKMVNEIILIK